MARATVKDLKAFFESDGGAKVTMTELKALKDSGGYDDVAEGIGDGTLTY